MRIRLTLAASMVATWVVAAVAADPPKLVVLIVVDQMRADYVDQFADGWTSGLKRLVTKGARFSRAAYPYLETFTCSGHATISTGAFPSAHGIMQNAWFDRDTRALVTCTEDASVRSVAYGNPVTGGESPAKLLLPSFADEMRRQRNAHVVALSLKARSAIMLAGHGGDAVTWLSDTLDGWETSTTYSDAPVPQVRSFVAAHPTSADYGRTWERLMPAARYRGTDEGLGESPPAGWTTTFPHELTGRVGSSGPDAAYYQRWESSPFADAYLARMAAALTESMELGKHDGTDVLAVSFSSPDLVGHAFGPRSQEIQDMYAHLDRAVGGLLDALDQAVGVDQYVVALTADHGVTAIPEQSIAKRQEGGRLDLAGIASAIEGASQQALGPGRYLARLAGNDVYLEPGAYARLSASPTSLAAVLRAIQAQPGVKRVFASTELAGGAQSRDTLLRAAALSYAPGRSGDIIIAPKPGWMIGTSGTTHGSANDDDQRVPIVFYGKGIRPGRFTEAATPADVAPTLAAIVGISMPTAQGRVLRSALRDRSVAGSTSASRP